MKLPLRESPQFEMNSGGENSTLQELSLMPISDKAAQAIAVALRENTGLQRLHTNVKGLAGTQAIADALRQHSCSFCGG